MEPNALWVGLFGFGMIVVMGLFGMLMSLLEYLWGKNDDHNRK